MTPARPRFGSLLPAMVAAASIAATVPVAAQPVESHYTAGAGKECRIFARNKPKEEMPWSELACPGRSGIVVRVFDADLRMTVSAGRTIKAAGEEPAASQSFGPFNQAVGKVEWRSTGGKPFAIIQRWTIADNDNPDKSGRPSSVPFLVVTRLGPGGVCHVAYVDARANPDANALARRAADDKARGFRCGADKAEVVGQRGRAVDLASPPDAPDSDAGATPAPAANPGSKP